MNFNHHYLMSFSTGGLFLTESIKLVECFMRLADWSRVREHVLAINLLQVRASSTGKRVVGEVILRLKELSPEELALLLHGDSQEQSALLWIAVCRHYRFIGEFACEVLRERYLSLRPDLRNDDFDAFYNRKSDWHPELEQLSQTTRKKLRQVLYKIMRDAHLLVEGDRINPPLLSDRLLATLAPEKRLQDLQFFPVFEADIRIAR